MIEIDIGMQQLLSASIEKLGALKGNQKSGFSHRCSCFGAQTFCSDAGTLEQGIVAAQLQFLHFQGTPVLTLPPNLVEFSYALSD